MSEIKIPKQRQVTQIKKAYKGWLKGVSLHADRPDGAGEDYLMGRAYFYLCSNVKISCGESTEKDLAEAVNLLLAHRQALGDLVAEEELEGLTDENKQKLAQWFEDSGRWIEMIDLNSIEQTRLGLRKECLTLIKKPKKPYRINKVLTDKERKQSEKIGQLAKGMQIKKIRDKADQLIYKVYDYNELINVKDKTMLKKLEASLFDSYELVKLINWLIKKRGDSLYPITKFWLESRLILLDQIIKDYCYGA